MEKSISFTELLLLTCYLGAFILVIGAFIFTLLIYRNRQSKETSIIKIIFFTFIQIFLSIILSTIIWMFWSFNIDVMFGIILMPSLIAEIITISLFYLLKRWIIKLLVK